MANPLASKTLDELLDLARGEQFPTPLEAELTARLGVLAVRLEAYEMVEKRPSRRAAPEQLSFSFAEDPANFNPVHMHITNYMENKP